MCKEEVQVILYATNFPKHLICHRHIKKKKKNLVSPICAVKEKCYTYILLIASL